MNDEHVVQLVRASKDALECLGRIIEKKDWGAIEEYADALDAAIAAVEESGV